MGSSKYLNVLLYKKTSQDEVTLFQKPHTMVEIVFSLSSFFFTGFKGHQYFFNRIIYLFFDILIEYEKTNSMIYLTISII